MRNQLPMKTLSYKQLLNHEESTMQNVQINTDHQTADQDFDQALSQFLKVEAEVMNSLHQIEKKTLQGKPLSNAQYFLRQLCSRGFFIDDLAREMSIELSALQGLFNLRLRELNEEDFSSLLFFYCAVESNYFSPKSIARANNGVH